MSYLLEDTPVPVIDLTKLEQNITEMARYCQARGVNLRPHIKAHKIPGIAKMQIEVGAVGVTVAKLGEAEEMAKAGIKDIFLANQVTGQVKMRRLTALARLVKLRVGIDSMFNLQELNQAASVLEEKLEVLLEIDSGLHRCGLEAGDPATAALARAVANMPNLKFKGIFTHAGHAYAAVDPAAVTRIGREEGEIMVGLAERLRREGIPVEEVSVGSTPTARYAVQVPGVTEVRPGNYVFYDATQVALGVTDPENCSLRVRATVISCPSSQRAVIDAGSKTLNLDQGAHGVSLTPGFGIVWNRPGIRLERLSEEHGVLALEPGEHVQVGEILEIIPNHACTVINLFDQVIGARNAQVDRVFEVAARGKVR